MAERRRLHSHSQYGSKRWWSAIDPAAIRVDRAHTTWRVGHIAGVLQMDSKGAFLRVGRGRLIHTVRCKGMARDFI